MIAEIEGGKMTTAIIAMMEMLGSSGEGAQGQLDLIRFLCKDEIVIDICFDRGSLGTEMENVLNNSDAYAIQGRGFSKEDLGKIDDVARGWMKEREARK